MRNCALTLELNGSLWHQNSPTSSKLCEASSALHSEMNGTAVTGNLETICCCVCSAIDWCFLSGFCAENDGCNAHSKDPVPLPQPRGGQGNTISFVSSVFSENSIHPFYCSVDADDIHVEDSGRSVAGSTGTHHRPTAPVGRVVHLSSLATTAPYLTGNDQLDCLDLDRPVEFSDICFISECDYITQHWRQMGWLMLKGIGYTMDKVRNEVMKDFLDASDSEKVIHLIEQWQHLRNDEATARALVDICCHVKVGGVKSDIVNALKDRSSGQSKYICIYIAGVLFVIHCDVDDGKLVLNSAATPGTDGWTVIAFLLFSIVVYSDHDPDCVFNAVVKFGCDVWLSIGLQLGMNHPQIMAATSTFVSHYDKLQALIHISFGKNTKAALAQKLLQVCKILPKPIHRQVMAELQGLP